MALEGETMQLDTTPGTVCTMCGTRYPADTQFCPIDGTKVVPLTSDSLEALDLTGDRIFGDYIIRQKLGEGGMGAVYLAENVAIGQKIAIKVLHPAGEQTEELVQRFNREAQTISMLTHPNIIRVFIFGKTDDGLIYLAMEFVAGRSLRALLDEHTVLQPRRAINIIRQVLHALAEAHELGIVHRDLKPDNVMLTKFRGVEDYVKVLDFGIAKVQEKDQETQKKLTQAGVVYGTPEYLSPEQAAAKNLDARSDLYSVGIILYEMMTGTVPFTGSTAHSVLAGHVFDAPPKPSELAPRSVDPEMERIILKCIEKSPKKRYKSAMELLYDLESVEARLKGAAARRTTALDASEASLVHEVSREAEKAKSSAAAPAPQAAAPQQAAPAQQAPAPQQFADEYPEMQPQGISKAAIAVIVLLVVAIVILGILLVTRDAGAATAASSAIETYSPSAALLELTSGELLEEVR